MPILNNPAGFLLNGATASGQAGAAMDARHCANYGYLWHRATVSSAIIAVQVSHDGQSWLTHSTITATNTSGTAQITDYLPYVRGIVTNRFGNSTAYVHYSPGLV